MIAAGTDSVLWPFSSPSLHYLSILSGFISLLISLSPHALLAGVIPYLATPQPPFMAATVHFCLVFLLLSRCLPACVPRAHCSISDLSLSLPQYRIHALHNMRQNALKPHGQIGHEVVNWTELNTSFRCPSIIDMYPQKAKRTTVQS